jgi:putative transposase
LKDIKARLPIRQRAGMPKFKKKAHARPSLNHTVRGFCMKDGRLHLAGGIVCTVVWSRELPCAPSSVRVYQDAVGHWYCSFVVPVEVGSLPETGQVIGIDWESRKPLRPRLMPTTCRMPSTASVRRRSWLATSG